MKFILMSASALFALVTLTASARGAANQVAGVAAADTTTAAHRGSDSYLFIGGCGGVYFLAEPGELLVDVYKRDRNVRGRHADLRAILVGPDREVLGEVNIPDDGEQRGSGPGPIQSAQLSANVERKGVYGLNITVSQDRYGEEILWGFRTNCPRYLIETSRGHKDEAHQEPIVVGECQEPFDVCFLPRPGKLAVEVTGMPDDTDPLSIYDGRGKLLEEIPVDHGRAEHTFLPQVPREAVPWRLHLPRGRAVVHLDGVTRWAADDPFPNLSFWTPDPSSWFSFHENRYLLRPFGTKAYGRPSSHGEVSFWLHNNAGRPRTINLTLEHSAKPWPVELSDEQVTLRPRATREIVLRYTAPDEGERRVHVRATPAGDTEFSTYSTLTVRAGTAPATHPLDMPLVLKPYRHENDQFGYSPDYPTQNQLYFDPKNRPFVRTDAGIATLRDRDWASTNFREAVVSGLESLRGHSFGIASTKVAFDKDGDVYALGRQDQQAVLLHSADGGKTFRACLIPGQKGQRQSFDFEQFSGHNETGDPPPILKYTHIASDPRVFWRRIHNLDLFLPEKVDGIVTVGQPIRISKQCIGLASHSGIPSSVVSRNGKVHVVWAEATDPDQRVSGVPTFVATCDRATRTLCDPALVGYGPPPNDIHNSPSITIDSHGYLHVLAGSHGRPFPYARSRKPNDAGGGWTEAEVTGEGLRQTYIGLVCGPDDTLHTAFRLWQSGVEPFPVSQYGALAYQRKRPGQPWESPRLLVVPPFSEYSVYYHRLTIDRRGRLFLSYDYFTTYWFYRNDRPDKDRSVLMSDDGGETWKLVTSADLP